jgi:hypothetical protein
LWIDWKVIDIRLFCKINERYGGLRALYMSGVVSPGDIFYTNTIDLVGGGGLNYIVQIQKKIG